MQSSQNSNEQSQTSDKNKNNEWAERAFSDYKRLTVDDSGGVAVKLKHEILEAHTESDAHELADILLKIKPDKDADAVEDRATKLLLASLILSASSQGNNCVQFFLDRLKESNPTDWLTHFQGRAKTNLEEALSNMTENYSKMLGQQLYMRIKTYVCGQSLR